MGDYKEMQEHNKQKQFSFEFLEQRINQAGYKCQVEEDTVVLGTSLTWTTMANSAKPQQ